MIMCVTLTIGYCEDQSIGHVALVHPEGFETEAEAIKDLAAGLYNKFQAEEGSRPPISKKCCKSSLEKDEAAAFCSKCGKNLEQPKFDAENHEQWLRSLFNGTCDSFGGVEIISVSDGNEWNPWNSFDTVIKLAKTGAGIVDLGFNSEKALTAALAGYQEIPEESRKEIQEYGEGEFFDDSTKKILGLPKYGSKKSV